MSNILFLLHCFPGVGGIEKVTVTLANGMCKKHSVCIVSQMCINNDQMLKVLDSDIEFHQLPDECNPLSSQNIETLNEIICKKEIGTVIYQDNYSSFAKILGYIRKDKGIALKVIVAEHNAPMCFVNDAINKWKETPAKSFMKLKYSLSIIHQYLRSSCDHVRTYNNSDKYILLSRNFKREFSLLNLFRYEKVDYIGNPLTIDLPSCEFNKRQQLLFCGSLNKRKGVDLLLQIWNRIEMATADWELMIVGEGEERNNMEKYIKAHNLSRVKLCGFHTEMIPFFSESKILLMTSRYEGFGLVLTEAMAYGCVPVAFNSFASVTDIITSDTGMLVKPFDINEYSNKVIGLMENNEKLEYMSERCIKRGREKYSLETIIGRWEQIL